MRLFLRWLSMNKWEVLVSLVMILISVAMLTEPVFLLGALNALRIPYAIFLTAYTVFWFIRNNKLMLSGGVIACLLIFPGIWQYFKPGQVPEQKTVIQREVVRADSQADLSVVHYNVKENNRYMDRLAEDVLAAGADVVSLQELRPETFPVADTILSAAYPYKRVTLEHKGFGMAIYSRYPIANDSILVAGYFPVMTGTINTPAGEISYLCATTSTPTSEKGFEKQEKEFLLLTQMAKAGSKPLILMGDLNAVPWSTSMEGLMEHGHLEDSRKDLSATFPSQSVWVQIPIDYILHSPDLKCLAFETLKRSSSNHLGIKGYYQFK